MAYLFLLGASLPALAQQATGAAPVTLFQNVRVFDGKGQGVSGPSDVLVRGNKIERIAPAGSIPPGTDAGARVIPGGGRVLMPGLIDAHWHTMLLAMKDADFAREAVHPDHGPRTIDWFLQLYAWHGRHHIGHIRLTAAA